MNSEFRGGNSNILEHINAIKDEMMKIRKVNRFPESGQVYNQVIRSKGGDCLCPDRFW